MTKSSFVTQPRTSTHIFTPTDVAEPQSTDAPIARSTPLAREYKGPASEPRARTADDPAEATHAWVGAGIPAWGRFEGDEPDKRFRVLAGSGWRRPVLNPEATTYDLQVKVGQVQDELVGAGVLDGSSMAFTADHVAVHQVVPFSRRFDSLAVRGPRHLAPASRPGHPAARAERGLGSSRRTDWPPAATDWPAKNEAGRYGLRPH